MSFVPSFGPSPSRTRSARLGSPGLSVPSPICGLALVLAWTLAPGPAHADTTSGTSTQPSSPLEDDFDDDFDDGLDGDLDDGFDGDPRDAASTAEPEPSIPDATWTALIDRSVRISLPDQPALEGTVVAFDDETVTLLLADADAPERFLREAITEVEATDPEPAPAPPAEEFEVYYAPPPGKGALVLGGILAGLGGVLFVTGTVTTTLVDRDSVPAYAPQFGLATVHAGLGISLLVIGILRRKHARAWHAEHPFDVASARTSGGTRLLGLRGRF